VPKHENSGQSHLNFDAQIWGFNSLTALFVCGGFLTCRRRDGGLESRPTSGLDIQIRQSGASIA
jgi:hypothetical protein